MTAPAIRISLLGLPSVTDQGGKLLTGLGLGKPLGMLAYLSLKGESRREELVNLFWGSLPEQKARNAFRQTLHRLRAAIGEERLPQSVSTVRIDPEAGVWIDVLAFDQALKRGAIDDALTLYRGPFLHGLELDEPDFDQWLMTERARLDARYQWALQQAVTAASARGDIQDAATKAALLTKASPLAADAAISEATVLVAAGRMAEARSSLERFAERYRSELGSDAPPSVREMLSRLRKQSVTIHDTAESAAPDHSFFGRERELGRLLSLWNDVRAGSGATVVITGEDGIGKSRLAEEFVERAGRLGQMLTLAGRERSSGSMIPFASIGRALRGALNAPGLSGASQHLLGEAARLLPELRDQFDLPPLKPIEDDASRLRFYEGVAALLDAVAYEQPVLVLLDDFHNAAPPTAQLMEYLSGRLAGVPVMFCILYRSGSVRSGLSGVFPFSRERKSARGSADIEHGLTRIELGPLSMDETSALIHSLADADVVPEEERQRIAGLSGGVPYRALELARQAAGGLNPTGVPATLKDALWARLQGCSPTQQRLFVASALLERPASIRLLAAASHLSEPAALDAVLALEGLGLVTQTPHGVKPGHDEAAALALEGTGPAGRALLAGWAAEALSHEPGARNAELAHLYSVAGNSAATFEHSIAAAYDAAAVGALDSVKHFTEVARQFVASNIDRKKLETLARIFEPHRPRLGSGEQSALEDAQIAATSEEIALTESGEQAAGEPGRRKTRLLSDLFARSSVLRVATATTIALALIALALVGRGPQRGGAGLNLPDTLFLTSRSAAGTQLYYLSGQVIPGVTVPREYAGKSDGGWVDSLALPLMNPRLSPAGGDVAVEQMTDGGPDIYLVSARGRQPRALVSGPGDDIIGGWSPDGRWLLVTHGQTLQNQSYDSDLLMVSADGQKHIPLDTATDRSVVEAAWSPDGTHIAWTARTGASHQQDVFISNSDGTGLMNVSKSDAEDYHIAWSPDGERLAFTSDRLGNAEIFAYDIGTAKTFRLTWDPAQDDHAVFSPDGVFVAFESTRGGDASVFVTRSWGSTATKVSGNLPNFTIARWGGTKTPARFVDRIQARVPASLGTADSAEAVLVAFDKSGEELSSATATWRSLDQDIARIVAMDVDSADGTPRARAVIAGLRPGLARIAVSAGGWRFDTALVQVGSAQTELVREDFESGVRPEIWQSVGAPGVRVVANGNSRMVSTRSGRQWESGILSRRNFPLRSGFTARMRIVAPFSAPVAPRSFSAALVLSNPTTENDAARLTRIASIEWLGPAARIAYSVERERWTEPVSALGTGASQLFEIQVDSSGRVAFSANGKIRWRSTLRLSNSDARARLWLGSQGAGDEVLFGDILVSLAPELRRR